MDIKAQDVKRLREKTGAGMLDCKNALVQAGGDFDKAERILKEQGLAAAHKKAGRSTGSGRIFMKIAPDGDLMLELGCETDFVARNDMFRELGEKVMAVIREKKLDRKTDELDLLVKEAVGRIKENIELKRFVMVAAKADETLVDYLHDDKIGVILRFRASPAAVKDDPRVKETLFNCALHAAAFAPVFFSREKVGAAWLQEQEEIFKKQVEGMGKPANVLAGIVKGKVSKLLQEVCFLEQPFVKDEKRKVAKVLEDLGKDVGGKVEALDYVYYKVGESPA